MDSPDVDRAPWMLFFYYLFGSILLLTLIINLWFITMKKKARMPPRPPGWPFVGNLFQLGQRPNVSFSALARKYGPLMTLHLGMQTTVVVSSPAMFKEFLSKNDNIFSGRIKNLQQGAVQCKENESSATSQKRSGDWHDATHSLPLLCQGEKCEYWSEVTSFNLLGNMIFSQNVLNPHSDQDADELKETRAAFHLDLKRAALQTVTTFWISYWILEATMEKARLRNSAAQTLRLSYFILPAPLLRAPCAVPGVGSGTRREGTGEGAPAGKGADMGGAAREGAGGRSLAREGTGMEPLAEQCRAEGRGAGSPAGGKSDSAWQFFATGAD
eukprot:Gb_32355 [translate_table: standard]